jgi:carboxymethylenebutenolidase
MCCRTDIDCAVAYYGTYIEHNIREAPNLHRPFMLHMAMKDRWVQAEVNELLERRLVPNPLVIMSDTNVVIKPLKMSLAVPIE